MTTTVILGVIGSDAHAVGITILEQALDAAGFDVRNLGVQTGQDEFVEAAATSDAEAVLVSSLYGHAERDCDGLHEALAERGIDPATYVGGNLAVGQADHESIRERFERMGFDRVFDAETDPEDAIVALRRDLGLAETDAERSRVST
ncbi:methylaspartate mutase subunit S [Salinarchaeum sp. Harcht-Bsk1]|uniref:methylaspartate mutase subunit S n=1 Tax=Salinarchaeum sp. Harcht-Bsk1 TaxID=1333523 RepID=UPI0003423B3A|nr:methylaspartate mutase subunit S [Salinarchaeum sp. Harcht-Bsk1]AGN00885.1 methylaspartate mutase subunit S [Salinarchaeum sp. Harcht-Bsk1]